MKPLYIALIVGAIIIITIIANTVKASAQQKSQSKAAEDEFSLSKMLLMLKMNEKASKDQMALLKESKKTTAGDWLKTIGSLAGSVSTIATGGASGILGGVFGGGKS